MIFPDLHMCIFFTEHVKRLQIYVCGINVLLKELKVRASPHTATSLCDVLYELSRVALHPQLGLQVHAFLVLQCSQELAGGSFRAPGPSDEARSSWHVTAYSGPLDGILQIVLVLHTPLDQLERRLACYNWPSNIQALLREFQELCQRPLLHLFPHTCHKGLAEARATSLLQARARLRPRHGAPHEVPGIVQAGAPLRLLNLWAMPGWALHHHNEGAVGGAR